MTEQQTEELRELLTSAMYGAFAVGQDCAERCGDILDNGGPPDWIDEAEADAEADLDQRIETLMVQFCDGESFV